MNWDDDRAVSEVLGYVITFSLIVTAASVLFVTGFGTIDDIRDSEQINNGGRAMIALSENLNDLSGSRGPKREGEIRLSGGTLTFDDSTTLTVEVDDGTTTIGPTPVGEGAIVYRLNDRSIWYETGSVFRSNPDSAIVEREPGFRCTPSNAILSTLSLTLSPDGSESLGKQGSVLIVGERVGTDLVYPNTDTRVTGQKDVTVDVSSTNAGAWERYFTESGWTKTGATTYRCRTENLIVRETTVRIDIRT